MFTRFTSMGWRRGRHFQRVLDLSVIAVDPGELFAGRKVRDGCGNPRVVHLSGANRSTQFDKSVGEHFRQMFG
jgi:hypothetical protein